MAEVSGDGGEGGEGGEGGIHTSFLCLIFTRAPLVSTLCSLSFFFFFPFSRFPPPPSSLWLTFLSFFIQKHTLETETDNTMLPGRERERERGRGAASLSLDSIARK